MSTYEAGLKSAQKTIGYPSNIRAPIVPKGASSLEVQCCNKQGPLSGQSAVYLPPQAACIAPSTTVKAGQHGGKLLGQDRVFCNPSGW